jgi:hypothetical protein
MEFISQDLDARTPYQVEIDYEIPIPTGLRKVFPQHILHGCSIAQEPISSVSCFNFGPSGRLTDSIF